MLKQQISNGEALNKLVELVKEQNGDYTYVLDTDKFPKAKEIVPVVAKKSGYVTYIKALEIGLGSMLLGGGRETMADIIDPSVGIILNKKIDQFVNEGEVLAYVYSNGKNTNTVVEKVLNAFEIGNELHNKQLILKVIR